ncbi:MAG: P-loop NTPase [Methanomicrobiales archaeon]|nr:P-loop NTPase [Methanomicrobiales archaeon]
MIRLAVVSGKGGTGKTVVTGAIARICTRSRVMVDCDVDAANLELLLKPRILERTDFRGMEVASIDPAVCTACGICIGACRFDAIRTHGAAYRVETGRCEGCRVCRMVCPAGAVSMQPRMCGQIFYSETAWGNLVHARLAPGAANSGLLVMEIKKLALSRNGDCDLMLIDGPPGIGCPLISTITGTDHALLVTEPSVSGFHDLERVVRVSRTLRTPVSVVINKHDLNPRISGDIRKFCRREDVAFRGEIPYDEAVMEAVRNGRPVTEYHVPASEAITTLWDDWSRELW